MKKKFIVLASAMAVFAACAPRSSVKKGSASTSPTDASLAAKDQEADVRDSLLHEISDLKEVHFSYNSDLLAAEARATLKANAAWLQDHAGVKIQVAGHCDQRGTVEYNLALGQRRAAAVRRYYKLLGVESGRIATISYGKEKPLCEDANEACWSRNRRAQTLAAFPQDLSKADVKQPASGQ